MGSLDDDKFDFGDVEFGLIRNCVAVWKTDSTGLNIYKNVGVVYISIVIVQDSGNRFMRRREYIERTGICWLLT